MSSKQHYNHVARNPPVECMYLRSAHRQAKRILITRAAQLAAGDITACTVLDLACGRGGDLPKCIGCESYTGIDTAGDALDELQRRAREMGINANTIRADAAYHPISQQFSMAMCNFAIHYFCDSEKHCRALIQQVANTIRTGGTFCGTYEREIGRVSFGEARHVVIGDCVNAVEWKVPWPEVLKYAWRNGLSLVYHAPLRRLHIDSDPNIWAFIMQKANLSPLTDRPLTQ